MSSWHQPGQGTGLLGIPCLCLCHSICCFLCLCNCLCHHRRAGGRGCQRVAAAGWGPFVRLNHGALLRHGHRHRRRPWRAALAMASSFSLPCGPRHHHHRRHKDPCRLHAQPRHQPASLGRCPTASASSNQLSNSPSCFTSGSAGARSASVIIMISMISSKLISI